MPLLHHRDLTISVCGVSADLSDDWADFDEGNGESVMISGVSGEFERSAKTVGTLSVR